ncbi:hypothetical protein MTO96_032501 [Rhipicephalus appendiculatus]
MVIYGGSEGIYALKGPEDCGALSPVSVATAKVRKADCQYGEATRYPAITKDDLRAAENDDPSLKFVF